MTSHIHDHGHTHLELGDAVDHHAGHAHAGETGHHHGVHDHGDHEHADHEHRGGIVGAVQSIFAPHSHDAADSIDTALEASVQGIRAVRVSLVAMLATAGLQVSLVLVTGSVALLADTIHNFADALTAVPLWIAFVVGRRLANRRYTYGYRRAEDLAGLFVLAMIIFSSAVAAWESVDRLIHPHEISNIPLLVVAGFIGFAGNELVAVYRIRAGTRIGSAALVADGYHARTDGLTSLAVVLGAIGVWLGYPIADPVVGLVITIAILFVLKSAAQQVFARLMDAVDPKLTEALEHAACQPGVQDVTSARLRWLGHRLEAEVHITVDSDLTTAASHAIAETVRHAIFHELARVSDVVVHVDPCTHDVADPHRSTREHLPPTPRIIPPSERVLSGEAQHSH